MTIVLIQVNIGWLADVASWMNGNEEKYESSSMIFKMQLKNWVNVRVVLNINFLLLVYCIPFSCDWLYLHYFVNLNIDQCDKNIASMEKLRKGLNQKEEPSTTSSKAKSNQRGNNKKMISSEKKD